MKRQLKWYNSLFILTVLLISCSNKNKDIKSNNSTKKTIENKKEVEIKVVDLSKEEINIMFTSSDKDKLNIKYDIRKVYKVLDKKGETFFIVSENFLRKDLEENKIIDKIELIIASKTDKGFIRKYTVNDKINIREKSLWFWTKFFKLQDFNGDGYIDPIIVYGGLGKHNDIEGRLIIKSLFQNKWYNIIHQGSDQDLARYTEFDKNFIKLDKPIRLEVIKLLREINEKYLSMNSETLELMKTYE